MQINNKKVRDLIGKDRNRSKQAAADILNLPDIEAWQNLIENSEYIFDFIKEKIGIILKENITGDNVQNIFSLMKIHSPDYDSFVVEGMSNFADNELNAKMLELLTSGSEDEKSYAAKYFYFTDFQDALDGLRKGACSENACLKANCAQTLAKLGDRSSYDFYLEKLNSEDDWEKVSSAEFLFYYADELALIPILKAMSNSSMAEHIAALALSFENAVILLDDADDNNKELFLEAYENIILGIPEILPIENISSLKIYEILERILEKLKLEEDESFKSRYAVLLLKSKSKIELLKNNSEYTYDANKSSLSELEEIFYLLTSENDNFWNNQIENSVNEINSSNINRKLSAISVISEFNIYKASDRLANMISNYEETELIRCEAVIALKKLNKLDKIQDKSSVLASFTDDNLLCIVKNSLYD